VRRIPASILILLHSLVLFAPLFVESKLPACCRKDGKHRCSRMDAALPPVSGEALQSPRSRCSQFPSAALAPIDTAATAEPLDRRAAPPSNAMRCLYRHPDFSASLLLGSHQDRAPPRCFV
jgi:hypothetical protein